MNSGVTTNPAAAATAATLPSDDQSLKIFKLSKCLAFSLTKAAAADAVATVDPERSFCLLPYGGEKSGQGLVYL